MTRTPQILLLALVAGVVACSTEREMESGVVVGAPDQYLGATVLLDSRKVGELQYLETHGGVVEAILKRIYGDSPAAHMVAVRIDVKEVPLAKGQHLVQVEKVGLPVATGSFDFPFKGEQVQVFLVDGEKIKRMAGGG